MLKSVYIASLVLAAALLAALAGPAAEAGRFNAATEEGRPISSYKGKRTVDYDTAHPAGTIIVDTRRRKLYFVLGDGQAIRYGVGVGRQGFSWAGRAYIAHKAEWPAWRPPEAMRKRQPSLPVYMEGGPSNPLGARALYLFQGGRDTLYRIHGTSEPHTIGLAVSSGCIRMLNEEVIDLYGRVRVGARVVVI